MSCSLLSSFYFCLSCEISSTFFFLVSLPLVKYLVLSSSSYLCFSLMNYPVSSSFSYLCLCSEYPVIPSSIAFCLPPEMASTFFFLLSTSVSILKCPVLFSSLSLCLSTEMPGRVPYHCLLPLLKCHVYPFCICLPSTKFLIWHVLFYRHFTSVSPENFCMPFFLLFSFCLLPEMSCNFLLFFHLRLPPS